MKSNYQIHTAQVPKVAMLLGLGLTLLTCGCSDVPLIPLDTKLRPTASIMRDNGPILAMERRFAHNDGKFPATTTVYMQRDGDRVKLFVCSEPTDASLGEVLSHTFTDDGELSCLVDWNPAINPTFIWVINGEQGATASISPRQPEDEEQDDNEPSSAAVEMK